MFLSTSQAFHVDGDAYAMLSDLKQKVKQNRSKLRLPHQGVITFYPPTVEQYKLHHPEQFDATYPPSKYTDAQRQDLSFLPVPFPVDEVAVAQLAVRLPRRITHQAVSSRIPKRGCHPSSSTALVMQMAQQMQMQMPMPRMELPGLKIFQKPEPHRAVPEHLPPALECSGRGGCDLPDASSGLGGAPRENRC